MSLCLFVGSYDRTLFGFSVSSTAPHLSLSLTLPSAHLGIIRSVSASLEFCASGGSDECISLLDITQEAQVVTLHHHAGDVNSLGFVKGFLYSGSDDGKIVVYRKGDWERIATCKGHVGPVVSVCCHGEYLMSAGKDRTIRLWDLMAATQVTCTKYPRDISFLIWSSDGTKYAVVSDKIVNVHIIGKDSKDECTITCNEKENIILTGSQTGISVWSISDRTKCELIKQILTGDRVKSMDILDSELVPWFESKNNLIAIACSNGLVAIWDVFAESPLAQIKIEARLTCLAVTKNIIDDTIVEQEEPVPKSNETVKREKKDKKPKRKAEKKPDVIKNAEPKDVKIESGVVEFLSGSSNKNKKSKKWHYNKAV